VRGTVKNDVKVGQSGGGEGRRRNKIEEKNHFTTIKKLLEERG
jgi:hypothetical protein